MGALFLLLITCFVSVKDLYVCMELMSEKVNLDGNRFDLSLSPTRHELTPGLFIVGVIGKREDVYEP